MYDLISIGHASIDLFFQGESLTYENDRFQLALGGKYFAKHFYESVGGGGANVAIGGAKNGLRTALVAKIGDNPFKHIILEKLSEQNVLPDLLQLENNFVSISSILLNGDGEKSVVHYSPPHEHIIKSEEDLQKISQTKAIYLGNLSDVSLEERATILMHCNKNNILTITNLGVKDCRLPAVELTRILENTKILILNAHEWADLVKKNYDEIDLSSNLSLEIPAMFGKILLITDAKNGSYGYLGGRVYRQQALEPEKILDTTGAGDGYTAGFIAEYLKTNNIETSMIKAAEYASKILSKIGAN